MNGLVLEGGARRCIFTAGVTDCFISNFIEFDYVAGVSAGAQVALDYAAGQNGRSKAVIMPYDTENRGRKSIVKDKLACDLDKIIYEFPYKKIPFAFKAYFDSDMICEMVATNCNTGKPEYFREKSDERLLLDKLCASCSVPIVCPMVKIGGSEYLDGSISDAIPFKRAFDCGCDRVVAVLAKPVGESATDYGKYRFIVEKKYGKDYPELTEILLDRILRYQKQCDEMYEYEKAGKLKIIRPSVTYVKSYETNRENLEKAYDCGYKTAMAKMPEIKEFLK